MCDYIQIKLSYLLDFVTPLLLFLQFISTASPSESDFLKTTFQKVTILYEGQLTSHMNNHGIPSMVMSLLKAGIALFLSVL